MDTDFSYFRRGLRLSLTSSKCAVSPCREVALLGLRMSAMILVICAVIAGGCVPRMLSGKTEPQTEPKTAQKSGLVKPRIDGQSEKNQVASVPVRSEAESDKRSSTEDNVRKESSGAARPSDKDSGTKARSESDSSGTATSSPTGPTAQAANVSNAARREVSSGPVPATSTSTTETSDPSKPPDPDEPIKRHDHSRYTELIKNKAMELVKQQPDSDHALLCKDAVTDQWSLVLHYSKERVYTFATYLWDEIDEKWQRAFVSDKRPLSGWQSHLRYQSSGKECRTLKRACR